MHVRFWPLLPSMPCTTRRPATPDRKGVEGVEGGGGRGRGDGRGDGRGVKHTD